MLGVGRRRRSVLSSDDKYPGTFFFTCSNCHLKCSASPQLTHLSSSWKRKKPKTRAEISRREINNENNSRMILCLRKRGRNCPDNDCQIYATLLCSAHVLGFFMLSERMKEKSGRSLRNTPTTKIKLSTISVYIGVRDDDCRWRCVSAQHLVFIYYSTQQQHSTVHRKQWRAECE